jgi:hypothetical protein
MSLEEDLKILLGEEKEVKYCCEKFEKEHKKDWNHRGHFEQDDRDKSWFILGCCYNCSVVDDMKFCPFCGTKLEEL